jgi:hypothetical protein
VSPGSSGYVRTDKRYRREGNSWGRFRDARERWEYMPFCISKSGRVTLPLLVFSSRACEPNLI